MRQNSVRRMIALGFAVACTSALTPAAYAGDTVFTWEVTSTADTESPGIADGACDAGGGACTLREAVKEANAKTGGSVYNEIQIPAGRYELGSQLRVGTGATANVEFSGTGSGVTTISGANVTRILVVGAGGRVDVRGLSLVQGNAGTASGGLVRAQDDGVLAVSESVLADGNAGYGGAIAAIDDASLSLSNTVVQDNTAGPSDGGGGVFSSGSVLTVRNTTFLGNSGGAGGGIYASGTGPGPAVDIAETTFADNTVTGQASALWVDRDHNDDYLGLAGSTFVGNSSSLAGAGALRVLTVGAPTTNRESLVFADNTGGNCFDAGSAGTATGSVSDDATCAFTSPTSVNDADPLLGPVTLQGGTVPVAIPDAGSPALARATTCNGGSSDARNFARTGTGDTTCDAGAAERIVGDVAVDGSSPVTTVQPGEVATVTVGLRYAGGREAQDGYVRLDAVPGAEIVSVDAYERTDPTHLICEAAAGGYDCIVNGGLNDRREVALRVRRATPGPAQVRVTGTSSFIDPTPADNELAVGPTVPAPPTPTGPSGPSHGDPVPGNPPARPVSLTAPSVSALTVKRNARTKRYVASFRLSKAGRVQLVLERRVKKGRRTTYRKVTTIVRELGAGKRSITLPAKLKGKKLARGTYRVSVRGVTATGRTGAVKRKTFGLR